MTRLNTQFSVKGISLLNSVMSSSVQFKKFLFNQVNDIAGNEVSPTKQARGDSGKEPKLHRWQNEEKTLGETISPLARFDCAWWKSSQKSIAIVQSRNDKGLDKKLCSMPLGRAWSFWCCAMQTCKIEQFLQCGLWKSAGQRLHQDFWPNSMG